MALATSLSNRLLVLIASVVLMVYGALTLSRTPVDVFPDLNKPTVTVMTEAGGMAAEEVEQLITFPLETTMNGLPGVETVRSVSSVGLSFLYVTFDWNTDIFRARQMVSERLASMEASSCRRASCRGMGPISSIMGEIMQIALPGRHGEDHADGGARVRRLGAAPAPDGDSRRRAGRFPSAARCASSRCSPTRRAWRSSGITHEQLEAALKGFSSNTCGGFLELNGREYLIRNIGRTSRLDDLKSLALTLRNSQPILLRQIADVAFAPAPQARRRRLRRQAGRDPGHPEAAGRRTPSRSPSRIEEALEGMKSPAAGMDAPT